MWRNKKNQKLVSKNWKAPLKTQIYSVVILKIYERNLVFESKKLYLLLRISIKVQSFLNKQKTSAKI